MNTTKIRKGQYITDNGYWIINVKNMWEVRNECTGEVYGIEKTKKAAINTVNY